MSIIDEPVKNRIRNGKVKSSSLRRREFREYRYRGTRRVRTDLRRSEHGMKRNAIPPRRDYETVIIETPRFL